MQMGRLHYPSSILKFNARYWRLSNVLKEENVQMVRRVVARNLPPDCDRESVVAEIMFEALKNKVPYVSAKHAARRCIYFLRRLTVERRANEKYLRARPKSAYIDKDIENADLVDVLTSVLTPEEKKLIWYFYIKELTKKEIAILTRLSAAKVSRCIEGGLYKMKRAL